MKIISTMFLHVLYKFIMWHQNVIAPTWFNYFNRAWLNMTSPVHGIVLMSHILFKTSLRKFKHYMNFFGNHQLEYILCVFFSFPLHNSTLVHCHCFCKDMIQPFCNFFLNVWAYRVIKIASPCPECYGQCRYKMCVTLKIYTPYNSFEAKCDQFFCSGASSRKLD